MRKTLWESGVCYVLYVTARTLDALLGCPDYEVLPSDMFRLGSNRVNRNKVSAIGDIEVVAKTGSISIFEPIAIIEHMGGLTASGSIRGHYVADIKTKEGKWYKTSDNLEPKEIPRRQVSKQAAVVLYFKKH